MIENPEQSKSETAIRMLADVLTNEQFSEKTRLNILRGLKLSFNKNVSTLESKVINGCDIEFLLDAISLADSEGNVDDGTRTEYFSLLLSLACDIPELHEKIKLELVRLIKNKTICDSFVMNLWTVLEKKSLVWPEVIQEVLQFSKLFFEEKIFEWVTKITKSNANLEELNVKYYAELSVHCCDIFKIITAILNEFVILTEGNERVLELVYYFTSLVTQIYDQNGKAIFKLYPKSLSHIVSLLLIPPTILSGESQNRLAGNFYKTKVLKLLLTAFKDDENDVLLLLTHYPEWLTEFALYKRMIEENG